MNVVISFKLRVENGEKFEDISLYRGFGGFMQPIVCLEGAEAARKDLALCPDPERREYWERIAREAKVLKVVTIESYIN